MREKLVVYLLVFWILVILLGQFSGVLILDQSIKPSDKIVTGSPVIDNAIDLGNLFIDMILFRVENVPSELNYFLGIFSWLSVWVMILVIRGM